MEDTERLHVHLDRRGKVMELTQDELLLIKSALRNDTVGKWGDGRQSKIDALLNKLSKEGK